MASKPKHKPRHTPEQLDATLSAIIAITSQMTAFHLFEEHAADKFDSSLQGQLHRGIVANATLDAALTGLRAFDEFFQPFNPNRPPKSDDVRAFDYGVTVLTPFLRPADRKAISKYISHFTLSRASLTTKGWDLTSMALSGLSHAIDFFGCVEVSHKFVTPTLKARVSMARRIIRMIGKRMDERERARGYQPTVPPP